MWAVTQNGSMVVLPMFAAILRCPSKCRALWDMICAVVNIPVSRGIPDDEKMTENCLSWDTRRVKLNIYIYTEVKWRNSTCYGISAKHPETGHAPHQWHRSPSQICLRKMLVTKPARYVYNIIIYYILYYIISYHIILYDIIIYYILYYSILYII